jgi:hypothetical protein
MGAGFIWYRKKQAKKVAAEEDETKAGNKGGASRASGGNGNNGNDGRQDMLREEKEAHEYRAHNGQQS